jgi:hypothetical protein
MGRIFSGEARTAFLHRGRAGALKSCESQKSQKSQFRFAPETTGSPCLIWDFWDFRDGLDFFQGSPNGFPPSWAGRGLEIL